MSDAPDDDRDDLRDLPLGSLEDEIASLAAGLASRQARWLALVAEFDRREGWASWGMRSCADWIAWRCSLSSRAAREQVQVARALLDLPLIRAEFEAGRLSYSKVRALTRVADAESEADLIELAAHTTASQLIGAVRSLERVDDLALGEREEARRVSWFWNDDGCLELRAVLPAEEGALLVTAIDAAQEELFALDDHESEDPRADGAAAPVGFRNGAAAPPPEADPVPPPTNADALLYVAEKALSRSTPAGTAAERRSMVVHLDLESDHAHIEGGPALHATTARRLGCDTSAIASIERGERVLSVGRRTRSVPPSIRRALAGRDPRCRFPGCRSRRGLDAHHVVHWQDGGETSLENLVLVCRSHHRALHEGGCSVEQAPDLPARFRFRDRHDRLLDPSSAAPPPPDGGADRHPGAPDPPGPLHTGSGERVDRALAVEALVAIRRTARERRRRGRDRGEPGLDSA